MPAVGYDHVERDAPTRTHEAVRSHAYIQDGRSVRWPIGRCEWRCRRFRRCPGAHEQIDFSTSGSARPESGSKL